MATELTVSKKAGRKPLDRPKVDTKPNQWVSNPKQETFMFHYLDPTSKTFGNIYQSGLLAGYSDSYAKKLASKSIANQWIGDYVNKMVLQPDHIVQGIQKLAITSIRDSDKLRAYELLAKMQGMLIDRSANLTANVSLEQLIDGLK